LQFLSAHLLYPPMDELARGALSVIGLLSNTATEVR
jgi:hypothetical protein